MRLACCQFDLVWEDKAANYDRVRALLDAADVPASTLVLLPEMFATGFTMRAEAMAEPVSGPTADLLAELAGRHQVWLQAGVVIREPSTVRPRNESLVFSPDGRLAARYAKRRLFPLAGESEHFAPGEAPVVFPWHDSLVAPAICYDLRFPELFRQAVVQGAELFTVIACWPAAREEHWLTLLRARAIENQCYVAAVNRCGRDPTGLTYCGRSQIIDPRGVVLAEADGGQAVIQADVDLPALRRYRHQFPVLRDMTLP